MNPRDDAMATDCLTNVSTYLTLMEDNVPIRRFLDSKVDLRNVVRDTLPKEERKMIRVYDNTLDEWK